jgi:hypothetical protein
LHERIRGELGFAEDEARDPEAMLRKAIAAAAIPSATRPAPTSPTTPRPNTSRCEPEFCPTARENAGKKFYAQTCWTDFPRSRAAATA